MEGKVKGEGERKRTGGIGPLTQIPGSASEIQSPLLSSDA